jgi:hypothetical protein
MGRGGDGSVTSPALSASFLSRTGALGFIMALAAGQASCILQRAPQQILDLTVDAAKIRSRPSLQRVVDLWIEPKRERFFIWHHAL